MSVIEIKGRSSVSSVHRFQRPICPPIYLTWTLTCFVEEGGDARESRLELDSLGSRGQRAAVLRRPFFGLWNKEGGKTSGKCLVEKMALYSRSIRNPFCKHCPQPGMDCHFRKPRGERWITTRFAFSLSLFKLLLSLK